MTCYEAKFEGILKANSEIEEVIWLDSMDVDAISEVDKIIFHHLSKNGLLD